MGWRSWNLFAGANDDRTMRAMMQAFVDKTRTIDGVPTSLAEIGYLSVGMDDGPVHHLYGSPQMPICACALMPFGVEPL